MCGGFSYGAWKTIIIIIMVIIYSSSRKGVIIEKLGFT